jgi:Carbohydrate-selective porin, OprB family/S-layer homology domain
MKLKLIRFSLFFSPVFLMAVLGISTEAIATEVENIKDSSSIFTSTENISEKLSHIYEGELTSTHKQTTIPKTTNKLTDYLAQSSANNNRVTSVSELSDVQPTDWAFQALQSLVEYYGVIAGYPDGKFRGRQAITRYEFAAGLNAALEKINELMKAGTGNLVRKEDLLTLERLQKEFSTELDILRSRVDVVEERVNKLETNQFSTTTKLKGEAIFAITNASGGDTAVTSRLGPNVVEKNTTFQQRVRLQLESSFTGKDVLITRLQAGNSQLNPFTLLNSQSSLGVSSSNTTETLGPSEQGTQTFQVFGNTNNSVVIDTLQYHFPVNKNLDIAVSANGGRFEDFTPTLNPFLENSDGGSGSLSAFGQRNPIYRLGGGQGIGVNYKLGSSLKLTGGYLASEGSSPNNGNGLFNGDYSALGQLTWTPSNKLSLAFTYINSYSGDSNFGFDNGSNVFGFTGTGVANSLNYINSGISNVNTPNNVSNPKPVSANSYGIQASYQLSPKLVISGWTGLTKARIIDYGEGDILNYAVTLALPDLGKKGNLGGIVFGAQPYLSTLKGKDFYPGDENGSIGLGDPKKFNLDIPLHLEAFYKYKVSDNVSITPGFIWLISPQQDKDNNDIFIGTVRTTFTF